MRVHKPLGVVLALIAVLGVVVNAGATPAAAGVADGFVANQIISNLDLPTAVDVASDGSIFVTEKRGKVLRYDGLGDPTPTVVADRRVETHNNADRGMLGLAVHPDYPAVPWVYVAYSLDRNPNGGPIPAYGSIGGNYDPCPNKDTTGCPALSRVVRFNGTIANSPETVLFEGHCQQFPFHTVGDLVFESSDALLVSFGDGSTGSFVEYGQRGNFCADPPGPAGTNLSAPSTEGGQARSQDLRTRQDPTGVHGSVLRVNPNTFAPLAQNPLFGDGELNAARIIATGFRNPYRVAVDSANGRIYVGNVGGAGADEINLVEGNTVFNSGWPCYEGPNTTQNTFWLTTTICQNLIADGAHDAPLFSYGRNSPIVPGEPCANGGLAVSGVALNRSGFGGQALDGALFFTDYTRNCIWYFPAGANGRPDTNNPVVFASALGAIVDLNFGPDGALYAVDIAGGSVQRITSTGGNQAPVASFSVTPAVGAPPLLVAFDGSASADPNPGDVLTFAWDFDGNGSTDATGQTTSYTYANLGTYQAALTVTDQDGLANVTTRTVDVVSGDFTVAIAQPANGRTFKAGARVPIQASATYVGGGELPSSAFSWRLNVIHCVPNAPDACHSHDLTTILGSRSYFVMPDHEYPSYVEIILTVDPPDAAAQSFTIPVNYRVVALTVETEPAGIEVNVGSAAENGPFIRPVAMSATTNASVASTQTINGVNYTFDEWRLNGQPLSSSQAIELVIDADARLTAVFSGDGGGPPDTERPTTPTGLQTDADADSINLVWNPSTDNVAVTGYLIYRSTNGTVGPLYDTSSTTAYDDTAVTTGVTYTYTVKATDAAGNISYRTNLSTRTFDGVGGPPDTERPTTPTGLQTDADADSINLVWNPSTDNVAVTGYLIYRSTNGTVGPLYDTSSTTAYDDTAVTTGVTYTYTVKATDAAGNISYRTNLSTELFEG